MMHAKCRPETFLNIRYDLFICLFLIVAILLLYGPVRQFDFINFDDPMYIVDNGYVQTGLNLKSIIWAFTDTHTGNWHPLNWLSYMMDVELFGLAPGTHHMTNVFFHMINAMLLFIVLKRMTNKIWQSGVVAMLFALHPLHVESVAWISERKDVLSAFFGFLTMWSYVRYVEKPGLKRYLPVSVFFLLGLMAKPMLVTLPFVLLLLDYWPLKRFNMSLSKSNNNPFTMGLVLEKIPLFFLTVISSLITFITQEKGGAVASIVVLPLDVRAANALVSYLLYLWKMICPQNLAVFYPYPETIPKVLIISAFLTMVLILSLGVYFRKKYPYVISGWLWYLGTLVPVIGLIQIGEQSMADRYVYIPMIGIYIIIVWGVSDCFGKFRYKTAVLGIIGVAVCVGLALTTRAQVLLWKNSMTLLEHTIKVTDNNYMIHNNLGIAYAKAGRYDEAAKNLSAALQINPDYLKAQHEMGNVVIARGDLNRAIAYYSAALKINPRYAPAHHNLGLALLRSGKIDAAISHFKQALSAQSGYRDARQSLNRSLDFRLRFSKACKGLSEALTLDPKDPDIGPKLGIVTARKKELNAAAADFQKALSIQPGFSKTHFKMDHVEVVRICFQKYELSLELLENIAKDKPDIADTYYHLACIQARRQKAGEAIRFLKRAVTKGFNDIDLIHKDGDLENMRKLLPEDAGLETILRFNK